MTTVSEISDRYITEMSDLDPVRGERWGVKSDGTRLTDYSPAGFDALEGLLRRTAGELDAATPTSEPERLGAGFLTDWVTGEADVIGGGERERWLSIITGPPASTRSVFDLMDRSTPEAWEVIAARLRAVPGALDGYRETLEWASGRARRPRTARRSPSPSSARPGPAMAPTGAGSARSSASTAPGSATRRWGRR